MPTDHLTDTPESLRALADELCALSATPDLRLTQVAAALDTAEDAIRRVADRLETPSNADELVRAIDAARQGGFTWPQHRRTVAAINLASKAWGRCKCAAIEKAGGIA